MTRYRGDDPHHNHDPFVDAHDDAAEAKAKAQEAALDPEQDESADRKRANEAVDADAKDKARHIGSDSKEGREADRDREPARQDKPVRKSTPPAVTKTDR